MITKHFCGLALGLTLGITAASSPAAPSPVELSSRFASTPVSSPTGFRAPRGARFAGTGSGFGNSLLLLVFQATAISGIADNAAASPNTNLFWSLHTATPAGSSQTTSEAAYTSYARGTVARTSGGHTVSGLTVALVSLLSFVAATGGSETETFFGIGKSLTSTGSLFFFGTVTPNLAVSNGTTPQITTASFLTLS